VAAPLCTVRLADAGARVIKIERPGGETARSYDTAVGGHSAYFSWLNRGKESAELDLKDPVDFELLCSMLHRADVLVQNLLPGSLGRLGLPPEVIDTRFPHLVVVSIVGYGQDTTYADMRAYDLLVQAESGLCAVTGTDDAPAKVGVSAADIATGANAHAVVLEALIERARTGRGTQVEVAMFDSVADWMTVPLLHLEHAGRPTPRLGMRHASIYPYGPFECLDGVVVVAVQRNDEWLRLCEALGCMELATRDEFRDNQSRVRHRHELDAELVPLFARRRSDDVIDLLERAGIAWSRMHDVEGLATHPALRRIEVPVSGSGAVTMPRPAGRTAQMAPGPVPALGEHTAALRREFSEPTRPTV
jgi:crotonobetainyl-CoA:carnitine CoA-transferase CaiB-like acyl-CoA transferase